MVLQDLKAALMEMKGDIQKIRSELHKVKNDTRVLNLLPDILEIDGKSLAQILEDMAKLKTIRIPWAS